MIYHLALILILQLVGEVVSRSLGLAVPGPVIGMVLLLILMIASSKVAQAIRDTAMGLLAHLSLLFVPAGVGIVGHLQTLGSDAVAIFATIIISTILSIIVGCYAFLVTARLIGSADE